MRTVMRIAAHRSLALMQHESASRSRHVWSVSGGLGSGYGRRHASATKGHVTYARSCARSGYYSLSDSGTVHGRLGSPWFRLRTATGTGC